MDDVKLTDDNDEAEELDEAGKPRKAEPQAHAVRIAEAGDVQVETERYLSAETIARLAQMEEAAGHPERAAAMREARSKAAFNEIMRKHGRPEV
jgi:hypothetical protein